MKRILHLLLQLILIGTLLLVVPVLLKGPHEVYAPAPDRDHPPRPRPNLTFSEAIAEGEANPRTFSLLINWRGQMILERYFHGRTAETLANLKSASKSVLAALIGIAIDQGVIAGVDEPISTYFPQIAEDPERNQITVEDLLSMRSGLQSTSNKNFGLWVTSPNWVRHILTRPMEDLPGGRMIYSTGDTHLLSAILTQASKESTWEYGDAMLTQRLGFRLRPWYRDPQGIYVGGNDMFMTPRQMMTIGLLYLHHGRYQGEQVVPEGWVQSSCEPQTRSPRSQERYGYGWWIREFDSYKTCYAWGFGGQYIFVVPQLELVMVATSSPDEGEARRAQRDALLDIAEEFVVKPIADAAEWDRLYSPLPMRSATATPSRAEQ